MTHASGANAVADLILDGASSLVCSGGGLTVAGDLDAYGDIEVTGGTLDVNGAATVLGSITVTNGSLGGAGTMAFIPGSTLTWTTGTLAGAGTTSIAAGATATLASGFVKDLRRDLENAGTFIWDDGPIDFQDATLTNLPGGTFSASPTIIPSMRNDGGTNAFVNQGDAEILSFVNIQEDVSLSNAGTLRVEDALQVNGGGSSSAVIDIEAGGLVTIKDTTFTLQPGATLPGEGELRVEWTLNVTTPIDLVGTLRLESGASEIIGAGDLTFLDGSTFVWESGDMGGSGTTFIEAGATLVMPEGFDKELRRDLVNSGAIEWEDGRVDLLDATLTNLPGGVIDVGASPVVPQQLRDDGGTNLFDNQGVFNVGSSATIRAGVPLANVGLIAVQQGTLSVEGGGMSSGTFDVAVAAGLTFADTGSTLTARSSITGMGALEFDGGAHVVNGTVTTERTITIAGGTTTWGSALTVLDTLEITGGTLVCDDAITIEPAARWSGRPGRCLEPARRSSHRARPRR